MIDGLSRFKVQRGAASLRKCTYLLRVLEIQLSRKRSLEVGPEELTMPDTPKKEGHVHAACATAGDTASRPVYAAPAVVCRIRRRSCRSPACAPWRPVLRPWGMIIGEHKAKLSTTKGFLRWNALSQYRAPCSSPKRDLVAARLCSHFFSCLVADSRTSASSKSIGEWMQTHDTDAFDDKSLYSPSFNVAPQSFQPVVRLSPATPANAS